MKIKIKKTFVKQTFNKKKTQQKILIHRIWNLIDVNNDTLTWNINSIIDSYHQSVNCNKRIENFINSKIFSNLMINLFHQCVPPSKKKTSKKNNSKIQNIIEIFKAMNMPIQNWFEILNKINVWFEKKSDQISRNLKSVVSLKKNQVLHTMFERGIMRWR